MEAVINMHVEINDKGVPYIAGTRTKVVEVVLDHLAFNWDAEEIHEQHPHLSLAQIHSALAYYYDHQIEMDQAIADGLRRVDEIQAALGESPIRAQLRALRRAG
jgi:uncharacterized protein (DUF433 family)